MLCVSLSLSLSRKSTFTFIKCSLVCFYFKFLSWKFSFWSFDFSSFSSFTVNLFISCTVNHPSWFSRKSSWPPVEKGGGEGARGGGRKRREKREACVIMWTNKTHSWDETLMKIGQQILPVKWFCDKERKIKNKKMMEKVKDFWNKIKEKNVLLCANVNGVLVWR